MAALNHSFFTENRDTVFEALQGGVLVAAGYGKMQRSNDTAFKFEQEANFWYLSGITHPDWWIILDGARRKSWLVMPVVDKTHALFDGSLSATDAKSISGIHDIIDRTKALELLRQTARKHRFVSTVGIPAHHEHFGFSLNPSIRELKELLERTFQKVEDFRSELATVRAIKSASEVAAIQSAINLTNHAFELVRDNLTVYKFEYEIEALFTHEFRASGAVGHAYDPIIAGGGNACTLHYDANQARLKRGSLLLMDVGARVDGYAADITRTYAVGEPTKRQRQLHQAVADAQKRIITLLQPGLQMSRYYQLVDQIMKQTLMDVGLLHDTSDDTTYRRYFPHSVGHGLGVDVHDSLGRHTEFKPGMVVTVEPGVYVPDEGVGVRIEDDILITSNGHRNLSVKLSTDLS
ncbi:MAG: M24 family metallopeptidase [Chloroflexi bacterium]|nr:MAG: M24 family metallopeptidase [Chloroflexota bacterium]